MNMTYFVPGLGPSRGVIEIRSVIERLKEIAPAKLLGQSSHAPGLIYQVERRLTEKERTSLGFLEWR